jgi:hypothetical protein
VRRGAAGARRAGRPGRLRLALGDLFEVVRSGADRNANVRLLVSDDGTVRCNRGKPVPMGAERLLTARQLARDLENQAALGLQLPRGRGAILSYRARLEAGTIAFSDRSRGRPGAFKPPRRLHERRRDARLQAAPLMAGLEVGRVARCGATRSSRWPPSGSRRSRFPGTVSPATAAGRSSAVASSAAASRG